MKMNRRISPLWLLLAAIVMSMTVLRSTVVAESHHITFSQPVTIGTIVLQPDNYLVSWTGSGPEVQVSFTKGNKTFATVAARLVLEKNTYDRAVDTVAMPDKTTTLKRIRFSDKTLVFDLSS